MKELLDEGYALVLDTNVLLNVYRYSPEFSEFALECLRAVSNHIILPATVHLEYSRHQRPSFAAMERRFAEIGNETEKQITIAKAKILDSCANLVRLQYPDVDDLKTSLSEKLEAVQTAFDNYFEEHASLDLIQHSWSGTDLLAALEGTLPVMITPTQEEIYCWCDEGEKRYKKQIPPGFKDAKNKDGVRKYSDLIIWKEILKYAKTHQKDIIFVTDDVKADWWEIGENGDRSFHQKLLDEFNRTLQAITPMTCTEFLSAVAEDYNIDKTDAVEIALRMTDDDYCIKISEHVFEEAAEELVYDAMKYINTETANIGSEGIDEFEIAEHEFVMGRRVARDDDTVIYEFTYKVMLEGTSYEYWGRDEDTRDVIRSDGRDHLFEGHIVVEVRREAEIFYDFEDDDSFETAVICRGQLEETSYEDKYESDPPGELGYCPGCGRPLNISNDGGNGFCIDCAWEH